MPELTNTTNNKTALAGVTFGGITLSYLVGGEGLDGAAALNMVQHAENFATSINLNTYEITFRPADFNDKIIEGEILGAVWDSYPITEDRANDMAERFNNVRQYEAEHHNDEAGRVVVVGKVIAVIRGRWTAGERF